MLKIQMHCMYYYSFNMYIDKWLLCGYQKGEYIPLSLFCNCKMKPSAYVSGWKEYL